MWTGLGIAAGAIGGALLNSNAAGNAADAQSNSTGAAIGEQARQFNIARNDLEPYRNLGTASIGRIGAMLGLKSPNPYMNHSEDEIRTMIGSLQSQKQATGDPLFDREINLATQALNGGGGGGSSPSDIMAMDPGYQFRLDQGQRTLNNQLRATGLFKSGQSLKAATRYGQDYASGEYGNVFNRLGAAAGIGQTATNTGVGAGANYAGTVGGYLTGLGNARGASAIASGNAYGNALGTIGNYYMQNSYLNRILNRGGGGGGSSGYSGDYAG